MPLTALIHAAQKPTPWDVGNNALYDLCRTRPSHAKAEDVIAKIWLIGRSYAAAIERRRDKSETNDDFYVDVVAPMIVNSQIDSWLADARVHEKPSEKSLEIMLRVHHETMSLFCEVSGLEKRSLASKYLHFHVPQLFYIYDSRAIVGLRHLSKYTGRASRSGLRADGEYRKFCEKCLSLQMHIENNYSVSLSPRELDNLLLFAQEDNAKGPPWITRLLKDQPPLKKVELLPVSFSAVEGDPFQSPG